MKSQLLRMKCVFKQQNSQMFGLKRGSNSRPFVVVGRGSETQLQMAEKLNKIN